MEVGKIYAEQTSSGAEISRRFYEPTQKISENENTTTFKCYKYTPRTKKFEETTIIAKKTAKTREATPAEKEEYEQAKMSEVIDKL